MAFVARQAQGYTEIFCHHADTRGGTVAGDRIAACAMHNQALEFVALPASSGELAALAPVLQDLVGLGCHRGNQD